MERTLFGGLSLLTAILAFSTWVKPGAIEEIGKLFGAKHAQAQSGAPDPKLDPARNLPDVNLPTLPTSPVRPAEWPGSPPDYAKKYNLPANANQLAANGPFGPPALESGPVNPAPPVGNPAGDPLPVAPANPQVQMSIPDSSQPIEAGQILARIGDEVILAADAMPMINEILNPQKGKAPEAELEKAKQELFRRYVMGQIETKLMYADAKRNIPTATLPTIEKNLTAEFDKSRLPDMIKKSNMTNSAELDQKLREVGSSVEKQRKAWVEQALGYSWMQQQFKQDEEVRRDDMLEYYLAHRAEYETPPQAKWEQLTARIDKFGSKEEAFRAVAEWGNEILRGASFSAVAKAKSQSFTAMNGGQVDWTTQGSLRSDAIDRAVFSLPVGRMSQIVDDDEGFHVVRVIDRKPLTRKPFEEMQGEIKKKLKQERSEKQRKDYLAKLRERTPVSTIWDPPANNGNSSAGVNNSNVAPGFQR